MNLTDIVTANETHFQINLENGRRIRFYGEKEVKFLDFVSIEEVLTMMGGISGKVNAKREPLFRFFHNRKRSCPIRGAPDDVKNVSYRNSPNGWMGTIFSSMTYEDLTGRQGTRTS